MGASVGSDYSLLFSLFFFPCGFLLFTFLPLYFFIFQGLDLLKRAGSLWEEDHKLEMETQHLEAEGLEKMEALMAGSEAEGFYGLLRGAISHSSTSPSHTPICHHLPSAPSGVHRTRFPDPAGQALKAVSPSCPSSFRGGHSCQYATPLYSAGEYQMSILVPG